MTTQVATVGVKDSPAGSQHDAGLDYVSCSPYRLPIARIAAAPAAIAGRR